MDDAGGEDGGDERRWGAPEDGHEMSRSEQKSAVRARLRAERRAASRSLLAGFSQQIVERLLGQDSIMAAAGVAIGTITASIPAMVGTTVVTADIGEATGTGRWPACR